MKSKVANRNTKVSNRNSSIDTILKYSLMIGVVHLGLAVFFLIWFALTHDQGKLMASLTSFTFAIAAGGPGFWRKLRPGDWS